MEEQQQIFEDEDLQSDLGKIDYIIKSQRVKSSFIKHIIENNRKQQQQQMGDFLNELLNKKLRILEELGHFKKVNLDFYPGENKNDIVVVCDLKEKTRFYLTASHTLSNHGGASFTTTGGLRNIFGYMDKFQFDYSRSLIKEGPRSLNIQLQFPYLRRYQESLNFSFSQDQRAIGNQAIQEHISEFSVQYKPDSSNSINAIFSKRANHLNHASLLPETEFYFKNQDYLPTKKFSFQYKGIIQDTVEQFLGVLEGKYSDFSSEVTVPFLSEVQFLKFEYNLRNHYPLRKWQNLFKSFRKMSLETNTNVSFVTSTFKKNLTVNDSFSNFSLRGYNSINNFHTRNLDRNSNFSVDNLDIIVKNSQKINIFNYPGLKDANIVTFLHFSQGYFFKRRNGVGCQQTYSWKNHFKENFRYSAGIGIALNVAPQTKLEVIYNLFHQAKIQDSVSKLQLRISLLD